MTLTEVAPPAGGPGERARGGAGAAAQGWKVLVWPEGRRSGRDVLSYPTLRLRLSGATQRGTDSDRSAEHWHYAQGWQPEQAYVAVHVSPVQNLVTPPATCWIWSSLRFLRVSVERVSFLLLTFLFMTGSFWFSRSCVFAYAVYNNLAISDRAASA